MSLFSEPHAHAFHVNITGSGDPFGSKLMRELLLGIDGAKFPNVRIDLQTNGVMLTPKYWSAMSKLHGQIARILISVDAATPETYAYTRRGGDWGQLNRNLRFLADLRGQGSFEWLRLDFVVQQANYREMPAFVELARGLGGVDQVCYSLIADWGSYPADAFARQAIWRSDHPEHDRFLEVLRDSALADPKVYLGNVSEYRRQALARL